MDKYGIIPLSIVPLRRQPTHKAEMVTQLLFGDTFTITDKIIHWYKVRSWWDGYEGWLEESYFIPIPEEQYLTLAQQPAFILDKKVQAASSEPAVAKIWLFEGSRLPAWNIQHRSCKVGDTLFYLPDIRLQAGIKRDRIYLTDFARTFTGIPYLWGGISSCGFDCSGFVQTIFRVCGYKLPRDASQQCKRGKDVPFIDRARPGDMAFFGDEKDKITHVGLILTDHKIIHASGKVRIDHLDHQGIYDAEKKMYSHKLRIIKNPFDD